MEFYEFAWKRFQECGIPYGKPYIEMHLLVYNTFLRRLSTVKNRFRKIITSLFDTKNFNLNSTSSALKHENVIFVEILEYTNILTNYSDINKFVSFYPVEVFKGVRYSLPKLYVIELADIPPQNLAERLIETVLTEEPHPSAKTKKKIIEKFFSNYYTESVNTIIISMN